MRLLYTNPLNPFSHTPWGRSVAAAAELFERTTRRYGKPRFGLAKTVVDWKTVEVSEKTVWSRPFCNLVRFERAVPAGRRPDPKLLIVAPMSGHYATLLRGTVEAMLPHADVHITDWVDARMVPLAEGSFDLDDYIDYIIDMLHALGPDTHVMAVCQPSVPVLAAVALMETRGDPFVPSTMTLMGGPIDTRRNPTAVNLLAEEKGIDWFRDNVIMQAPWPVPGFGREVYPGFLQLSGFMSMNLDRHIIAHKDFFMHLVKHDGDNAEKHREFYDEYLAVMDLTAEFYLQTVDTVFVRHALPKGEMTHRGAAIDPSDDPQRRAVHGRGRERRYFRPRPDQGRARSVRQHPRRQARPLHAAGGRPLRRLQRLALPLRNRAAHRRLHHQLWPPEPRRGEAEAGPRRQAIALARGNGASAGDGLPTRRPMLLHNSRCPALPVTMPQSRRRA